MNFRNAKGEENVKVEIMLSELKSARYLFSPEVINTEGKIKIIFDEDMTGYIALETEDGEDVGWIGNVEGNTAILELVKGRELKHETTYVIVGKVTNAAGISLDVSVPFVTQAKA